MARLSCDASPATPMAPVSVSLAASGPVPPGAGSGAARALYVPVRIGPAGCVPRLFRTGARRRTAVAFTTRTRLLAALGGEQTWIRLSEAVLRSLTEPLDGVGVLVDPRPVQATAAESPTR